MFVSRPNGKLPGLFYISRKELWLPIGRKLLLSVRLTWFLIMIRVDDGIKVSYSNNSLPVRSVSWTYIKVHHDSPSCKANWTVSTAVIKPQVRIDMKRGLTSASCVQYISALVRFGHSWVHPRVGLVWLVLGRIFFSFRWVGMGWTLPFVEYTVQLNHSRRRFPFT